MTDIFLARPTSCRCDRHTRYSADATAAPRTTHGQVPAIASFMWPWAMGVPQRPSFLPHSQTSPAVTARPGRPMTAHFDSASVSRREA